MAHSGEKKGAWWLVALLAPALPLGWSICRVMTLPPELQGGWDVPILMWAGGIEASAIAFVFSLVSLLRKERKRYFALLTGLPGLALLLWSAGVVVTANF